MNNVNLAPLANDEFTEAKIELKKPSIVKAGAKIVFPVLPNKNTTGINRLTLSLGQIEFKDGATIDFKTNNI